MSKLDEIRTDLHATRDLAWDDGHAGPFALRSESHHPLVATERCRARLRNRMTLAVCLACPIVTLICVSALSERVQAFAWTCPNGMAPDILAVFVSAWPLAMILGAAWRCASAVLSERDGETALQLVLTPIRKRTIAASKVLPHVGPFLWGIVAALPLYALAGNLEPFLMDDGIPSPLALWPLRIFASLAVCVLPYDTLRPSPTGIPSWLVMMATDLGLVWVAAHWGAGLAVRTISLPLVALRILLRMLLTTLAMASYLFPAFVASAPALLVGKWLFDKEQPTATLAGIVVFCFLWWLYPLRNAVRKCLDGFSCFDRLAMDPEDPTRKDSVRATAWWWYDGRRA